MKKILTVVIVAAALQLALVSAASAAPSAWGGGYNDCAGGGQYHCVRYGETLYSIGRMYNANPHCLAQANGLWDPNVIYAGQMLYIPANCGSYPWYGHGNCGQGPCGQKPVHYYRCTQNCEWGGSYPGYNPYPPKPTPYGYDYTGYYYGHGKDRYSHTCGYNNNCW